MGNSASQVAVKQTRTELSIQPAIPLTTHDSSKPAISAFSHLEREINDLILQSNIKIVPQDPNPQSIAALDQSFRRNQILKQTASAVSSPEDPNIASKLLYIRKHIHRDIFTTYTSNHYISSDPAPLHETYLVNRDPAAGKFNDVYFSGPPESAKPDIQFNAPQPGLIQSSQSQNSNSASRYRHKAKKPSIALSEHQIYQQQPQSFESGSQSTVSTVASFNPNGEENGNLDSDLVPITTTQTARLATLQPSSSTSLLPPVPENLVRRSVSSLKDVARGYNSASAAAVVPSASAPPPTNGAASSNDQVENRRASYFYSPIVTQTDSFHADIMSLASEQDHIVDLGSFPQYMHYTTSDFQPEDMTQGLTCRSSNG